MGISGIEINDEVFYAIDIKGVAIINKKDNTHFFIPYPDAAIFSVLIENYEMEKSKHMLQAILGRGKAETDWYISQCIKKWKDLNIFR